MPAPDLAHNPQPYRMHCPDKHQLRRLANKLRDHPEFSGLVAEAIDYILFLEIELMNVAKLTAAVTKKYEAAEAQLAGQPTPPPADHVLTDADVSGLTSMAAAFGTDTDGNDLPAPPPAPVVPDPATVTLPGAGGQ